MPGATFAPWPAPQLRPRLLFSRAAAAPRDPGSSCTPLLDAVRERGERSGDVPFHVPGHKRGSSTPAPLRDLVGPALRYDLTELDGLDFLASPTGVIQEAQQLAADTWGADATWFLVNGTTVGIHAAVMATCGPGDTLIVARNAHLSAFHAMVLAGCDALYVQPELDPAFQVAHHVTVGSLRAALEHAQQQGRRVGAVLVVSPTYFGVTGGIAGLAQVCHEHGVPLIVDEAHGAHLGLHPSLPPSALQQGADVAVQSTHKQLSAMTQAAMLHAKGPRVSHAKLARALQVLQSSSPSYLLMASLDAARAQASDPAAFEGCLAAAAYARQRIEQLSPVTLLSEEYLGRRQQGRQAGQHLQGRHDQEASMQNLERRCYGEPASSQSKAAVAAEEASLPAQAASSGLLAAGPIAALTTMQPSPGLQLLKACHGQQGYARVDPLRLTLSFEGLGLSGYQAAQVLESSYGIVPELAGPACVVLAMSIGSTMQHAEALVAALEGMCQDAAVGLGARLAVAPVAGQPGAGLHNLRETWEAAPQLVQPAIAPRAAHCSESTRVPVEQAAGQVSAELLCPYPPGVPAVLPGEVITEHMLDMLLKVLISGGRVAGCADPSLRTVAVLSK
ncbi:hypothetical protein N2152v2_011130 [Parachlorella kessleri]